MDVSDLSSTSRSASWSVLDKRKHIQKLSQAFTHESHSYHVIPTQTWMVYWISHSLALLGQQSALQDVADDVIEFLLECAHAGGGYGGGPGQIAHMATTFASVNALITLGSEKALESIDRAGIVRFLHRVKQEDGSFAMHDDGEIDSRASYCALSILKCLNIRDSLLLDKTLDWVLSCQTYEGGFGSVPGGEAHGGYTFCCVASLCLLNQLERANLPALLRWLTQKQLAEHGGFNGRSNKFVDSCYSYWQGAVFPLTHSMLMLEDQGSDLHKEWLFDAAALQDYILNQCQASKGLLRDKPNVPPDYYHTCYALSGLSISQHQPDDSVLDIGSREANVVENIHPLFNLTIRNLNHCFDYFESRRLECALATKRSQGD